MPPWLAVSASVLMPEAPMAGQIEKPQRIGTEITVRISLTFQEAPAVHTLLAMTPVRERGKLVRVALERYIAETGHSSGNVEQQIHAISTWLRSRTARTEATVGVANQREVNRTIDTVGHLPSHDVSVPLQSVIAGATSGSNSAPGNVDASSSSMKRWLQA